MLIVSLYSFILRAVLVKFVATGTDPHEGQHFVCRPVRVLTLTAACSDRC